MKLHADAALSLKQRELLVSRVVDEKWSPAAAAAAAALSERRAGACVRRFKPEREPGLLDRSSAPKHVDKRTPADRVEAIAALRRLRMTGAELAEALALPAPTVCGPTAASSPRIAMESHRSRRRLPLYCGEFPSPSDGKSPQ